MSAATATVDIPQTDLERRYWVQHRLRVRQLSLRALARQEGITHQAVCDTFTKPNAHVEKAIAEACEVTVEQLFPERFDPDTGHRLYRIRPQSRTPKITTPANRADNVYSEKAA